jgi:hypothetical protein
MNENRLRNWLFGHVAPRRLQACSMLSFNDDDEGDG